MTKKIIRQTAFLFFILLKAITVTGQPSTDNQWIEDVIVRQEEEKAAIAQQIEQLKTDIKKNEKTISTSNSIISMAIKNGNSQAEKIARDAKLKAEEAKKTNEETLKLAEIRLENTIIAIDKLKSSLANKSWQGKQIQSVITGCKGAVYIKKENGEVYDCNRDGSVFLERGDIISTHGTTGTATMQFLDGRGTVNIDKDSKVKIYSDGDLTEVMDLIEGKIKLEIRKAIAPYKKKFEVRRGSGTAGVRGTELQVAAINQYETEITVFEGIVDVKGTKEEKTVELKAGYKIIIAKDGTLSTPELFDISAFDKWRKD